MSSLANTGYCLLGAPPDDPVDPGVEFPPVGARAKVTVKYTAKAKLQKAVGGGKDDAKTTFTGKEVRSIEIDLSWPDIEPSSLLMEQALLQLSPAGPNAGKPWAWTERFAGIHDVSNVIVEELEGPTPKEGSDDMTAKLKMLSWVRPTNSGAGTGTTPKDAAKGVVVKGFGGDPSNAVSFPTAPKVTP